MLAAHPRPTAGAEPSRFYALHAYRSRLRTSGILKDLSQSAALTLLALADFADPRGHCWPSTARLEAENPLGERSIQRALNELEARGLLVREQRTGRTAMIRLVMNLELLGVAPATVASRGANVAGGGCHGGTLNMANLTDHGSKQQQGRSAVKDTPAIALGASVVVSQMKQGEEKALLPATSTEEAKVNPSEPIVLLAPDVSDRLREAGLAPPGVARITRYGDSRIRYVLDELERQRRVGKAIENPAGWIMAALKDGWYLPGEEPVRQLSLTEALITASAPPDGTRWMRWKGGSRVLEVVSIHDDRVELRAAGLVGAVAASILPRAKWPEVEWLDAAPDEPKGRVVVDPDDEDYIEPESIDPELLRKLRGMAMWVACFKPGPEALATQAETRGIAVDEWEAFEALQALAAAEASDVDGLAGSK